VVVDSFNFLPRTSRPCLGAVRVNDDDLLATEGGEPDCQKAAGGPALTRRVLTRPYSPLGSSLRSSLIDAELMQ
jgi:hypothetical protein